MTVTTVTPSDDRKQSQKGKTHGEYECYQWNFGVSDANEDFVVGIDTDDWKTVSIVAKNGEPAVAGKTMEYKVYVSNDRINVYSTLADVQANCAEITGGITVSNDDKEIIPTAVVYAIGGTNYNVNAGDYHTIYITAKGSGATAADNQDIWVMLSERV